MAITVETSSDLRPRRKSAAEARQSLRDTLWPSSEGKTWDRRSNQGFTTVPRLLSLILVAIKDLSGKSGDASRVYLDLWLRAFDEGFVNVLDDEELAYSAGYKGSRATRSWRERMLRLQELGFIDVKPRGNIEIGYVVIWDPLHVCAALYGSGKISHEWWHAFVGRAHEIGATIPKNAEAAKRKPK